MLKKRVIGAVFALAVTGAGVYGGHKIWTLPDTMLSERYMHAFIEECSDKTRLDLQGCVLGKLFESLPIELAHAGAFIAVAGGMIRYRRKILNLV